MEEKNSFLNKNINYFFILSFLAILTFLLRLYKFDQIGFWGDEYLTFTLSEPIYNYNFIHNKVLVSGDLVPPFYYFVLNIYNFFFRTHCTFNKSFSHYFWFLKYFTFFFNIKINFKKNRKSNSPIFPSI
jgi:hypothetical protein